MAKSLIGLLKEIYQEFNLRGFLFNRLSNRENGADSYVSYYRPVSGRGRDQLKCLIAYFKTWRKTGDTSSYCHSCPNFFVMTCMESSAGESQECSRGHYRFEAT